MEFNYNNITFLTKKKWLYYEYRASFLFNMYNFNKLFLKINIFYYSRKK